MPRLTTTKHAELEAFWRAHLDAWRRSVLNQREYCEVHGLPLKRFGNWRAKYRHEDRRHPRKVLYRRNGDLSHMTRACRQLSQQSMATRWTPARKFLASFS